VINFNKTRFSCYTLVDNSSILKKKHENSFLKKVNLHIDLKIVKHKVLSKNI